MIRIDFQICNTNSIQIHILSLHHNGFSLVYIYLRLEYYSLHCKKLSIVQTNSDKLN